MARGPNLVELFRRPFLFILHSGDDEDRQRAVFYVQRELESSADTDNPAIVLCDRGTVDGAAYWPGPDELWSAVGTTLEEQLRRTSTGQPASRASGTRGAGSTGAAFTDF